MKTEQFELPTAFTPTQLEILRALVSTAQSKRTRVSPELHNLSQRLDGYVETARVAVQTSGFARAN